MKKTREHDTGVFFCREDEIICLTVILQNDR